MAYGQVNLHPKQAYEDIDKIARSGRDIYELIEHPFPSDLPGSEKTISMYACADETSGALNSKQQQHSVTDTNSEGHYEL